MDNSEARIAHDFILVDQSAEVKDSPVEFRRLPPGKPSENKQSCVCGGKDGKKNKFRGAWEA
jgi:hypothetical protein